MRANNIIVCHLSSYLAQKRVALDDHVCTVIPEFSGKRPIVAVPDPQRPSELINVVPPTTETFEVGGTIDAAS